MPAGRVTSLLSSTGRSPCGCRHAVKATGSGSSTARQQLGARWQRWPGLRVSRGFLVRGCARVSSSAFLRFALSRGCAKPCSWKGRAECGCRYLYSVVLLQAPAQGLINKSPGRDRCSLHSFILQVFVDTCVCHALMIQQWTGHIELRLLSERQ